MASASSSDLLAATTVIATLENLHIPAGTTSHLAMLAHNIKPAVPSNHISFLVFFEHPLTTLKQVLISNHPESYSLSGDKMTYLDIATNKAYNLTLEVAGTSATNPALNFPAHELLRPWPGVVTLSRLLTIKMHSTFHEVKGSLPGAPAKGEKKDMLTVAKKMEELFEKYNGTLTEDAQGLGIYLSPEDLEPLY